MFKKTLVIAFCILCLAACADNKSDTNTNNNDSLQKGLDAVAENDLGKAEALFEAATDKNAEDQVAQAYYKQVLTLRESEKLITNGEAEQAKTKLLLVMDQPNGSKVISAKAEELLASVETKNEASSASTIPEQITPSVSSTTDQRAEVIKDVSGMTYVQLANADGNIRSQPAIESQVVHNGHLGDVFIYLQEKVNTSDGRTWYKVEYGSGSIGYISRAVANLTNEQPHYVRLIESGTNVRSQPSLNSAVIYTGQINDIFYYSYDKTYTQDGRTWLHVTLGDGTYGYVSQKVATLTTQTHYVATAVPSSTVVITEKEGNIRSQPSINSPILYNGIKGDVFYYLDNIINTPDGRTWYEVQFYGEIGYVSKAVSKLQ